MDQWYVVVIILLLDSGKACLQSLLEFVSQVLMGRQDVKLNQVIAERDDG